MQKKITIIGGAGFVGTNLAKRLILLQQDFEIIDLKLSKQFPRESKIGDVRDYDSLRSTITGNVVVHLAAVHRDDVRDKNDYELTNVHGTENVVRVCRELEIQKIVFTSSVAVYGFAEPGTNESGPIKPYNEYGRTKFEAEERLRAWFAAGNNSLIIVRPTVIFGEGNRGNVFNLLKQISSGKFLMVGKGKNKKSMAYVENVVSFIEACILTNTKYGLYNYVDTPDLTMNELVSHVRSKLLGKSGVGPQIPFWVGMIIGYAANVLAFICNRQLPISSIRVKKFTSSTEFRSAKNSLDNFRAPFDLSEGLQRTLESEFISPDPNREVFFTE